MNVFLPTPRQLKQYCIFSNLSNKALEELSKKLQRVSYCAGSEIIQEASPADSFFFIHNGEVEVMKMTRWGQTSTISIMGKGEIFGEMALLTSSLRSAAVIAKTDVDLFKLMKKDFEQIVLMDSEFSKIMQERFTTHNYFNQMKSLEPFELCKPYQISLFLEKMRERKYAAGEHIITQGQKGEHYYVITSGRVAVLKQVRDEEPKRIAVLVEGEGFGEEALITEARRNATVQALDETTVWELSKSDFNAILKTSFLEEVFFEDIPESNHGHYLFIDVRSESEFHGEHIPEALNIPLDELRQRYYELDKTREYYAYCQVGVRSATAAFLLTSRGIKAKAVRGGLSAWEGPLIEGKNEGVHSPTKPT
jgi:CRP-like cAMP-binding protein